jgi:hypothetical protein
LRGAGHGQLLLLYDDGLIGSGSTGRNNEATWGQGIP